MTLFGREESLLPGLERLVRHWRAAYRRRQRTRGPTCIRCGALATQSCEACRATVCERCWVVSIETGMVSALCVDCSAGSRRGQRTSAAKIDAAELFRSGFRVTGWSIAAVAAIAYWQRGIVGLERTAIALFDPAILFALVPLAFFLGAVRARFLALVRRLVSERSAGAGS